MSKAYLCVNAHISVTGGRRRDSLICESLRGLIGNNLSTLDPDRWWTTRPFASGSCANKYSGA